MLILHDPRCSGYGSAMRPEQPARVLRSAAHLRRTHPDWTWREPEAADGLSDDRIRRAVMAAMKKEPWADTFYALIDVKGADLLIAETIGMKRVIADRGYDANRIRAALREQGTIPVIPGRRNRKRPIQYDERRYKDRWRVEAMFCRLKDFRRIATRYDKLARNFLSAVSLAAAVAFWL